MVLTTEGLKHRHGRPVSGPCHRSDQVRRRIGKGIDQYRLTKDIPRRVPPPPPLPPEKIYVYNEMGDGLNLPTGQICLTEDFVAKQTKNRFVLTDIRINRHHTNRRL